MKVSKLLGELTNMINEMNSSNSSNHKKEVLKKYKHLEKILFYTYNPFIKFNITSKNVKKLNDDSIKISEDFYDEDLFDFLDKLNTREISGHDALKDANAIAKGSEYPDTFFKVIDKNLETRANATLINDVFPGMIPEFKVQLAKGIDDVPKSAVPNFERDTFLSSRKMDGLRCVAFVKPGDVKLFSRTGKQFLTLSVIEDELRRLFPKGDFILDGEVCMVDKNGNEDFQSILREWNKKNHTIENPKFKVFDKITYPEFFRKKGDIDNIFSKRYNDYYDLLDKKSSIVTPLKQTKIENKEHLDQLKEDAFRAGWEGLIVKKDVPYEGKRSNNLLKVKSHKDAEFEVKRIITGPIRYINPNTGSEETRDMLASVKIEFKGNEVGVGSGFSMEQRMYYYENLEELIGKTITVRWMEETEDENGNPSLRHTRIKAIHGNKREV